MTKVSNLTCDFEGSCSLVEFVSLWVYIGQRHMVAPRQTSFLFFDTINLRYLIGLLSRYKSNV